MTKPEHTRVCRSKSGGSDLTQVLPCLQALCLLADLCQSLDHTLPDTLSPRPAWVNGVERGAFLESKACFTPPTGVAL